VNPELDPRTADRETLLALIAQQRVTIAEQQVAIGQLQQRVDALEARLGARGKGMPGNKPSSPQPPRQKQPRKKRDSGFGRLRMTPTERVEHALATCPDCGTPLSGGWVQRTREVIDLPLVPAHVTEHAFVTRVCPRCRRRQMPEGKLPGVAAGRQRFGTNLVSLITVLREDLRLPIATIQRYLHMMHQLPVSQGGIVEVIHRVARRVKPAVDAVREQVRGSPVAHADETGWRQDGANGYVWTFSTPTERYFLRRGRHKEVVDEVLGESFEGVLVSDFYAAYHHYPGLKQRCWVHLLRDIHELKELYPEDAVLSRWAEAIHQLYTEAKAFTSSKPKARRRAQLRLERRLMALCRPFLDDPLAVQGKLCRRMERFREELFVFVAHPEVSADNNAAERSLRHLVTSRRISGGTRSARGTDSKMTLASLFGTWRARGLNPFPACRALLASPQL
jgi:transposase